MKHLSVILSVLLLVVSCNKNAESNYSKFQDVLDYYANDSLKLRAAHFLIDNMSAHYSFTDGHIDRYCDAVDSLSAAYRYRRDDEQAKKEFKALSQKFSYPQGVISDLQAVSAEFLIDNIDRAFSAWQSEVWNRDMSFEDFCEYLLPYKVCEFQSLDKWRSYLADPKYGDLQYLHFTGGDLVRAADIVNSALHRQLPPYGVDMPWIPTVLRPSSLVNMLKIRDCEDYVCLEASALRAKGVPVAVDFTPLWPGRSVGHAWCTLLHSAGFRFPFTAMQDGVHNDVSSRLSKTYRRCFAINPELVALNSSGEPVPTVFRNLCLKDVTDEYHPTVDIEIAVKKTKNRYAYLCMFDCRDWQPIAFGKIKRRKVRFEKLGKDIVYLAAILTANGLEPVSEPFLLDRNGQIRPITADQTKTQTLTLNRKHPCTRIDDAFGRRVIGSRFEAANRADFSDAVTVGVVETFGTEASSIAVDTTLTAFRYWRHVSAPEGWGNMAEVRYISGGKNITPTGKTLGTKGQQPY
jgi:hypothetical protein